MSEKWTIRELTIDEYPGTQLRFHYWEEDAQQMVAVPLMREALYDALVFIEEVARDCGLVPKEDVLIRINAALKAVEGKE